MVEGVSWEYMRASSTMVSADTSVMPSAHSGVHSAICSLNSDQAVVTFTPFTSKLPSSAGLATSLMRPQASLSASHTT